MERYAIAMRYCICTQQSGDEMWAEEEAVRNRLLVRAEETYTVGISEKERESERE